MNRRDMLRLCGLTGVAWALPNSAFAQAGSYEGPLFISVHAGGGWDPTSFCDPKGRATPDSPNPINNYLTDDIRTLARSPVQWAPFAENEAFFTQYARELLVVNGIEMQTNGHEQGTRNAHSGSLKEGQPAFTAMVAATQAKTLPLAYITSGGYDVTRGIVSRTRVGNVNLLRNVAEPNRFNDNANYHTEATFNRIQAAQAARTAALKEKSTLPRITRRLDALSEVRGGGNDLKRLMEFLPNLDGFETDIGRRAALAMAGYRAGLTASASISTGGFDTHGNHDQNQATALARLTNGLGELWSEVERLELADRVVLMVGSDFGRTPGYNEGNGKDHWPTGSMLFMGAGIRGNRVVGASDDGFRPLNIDPDTLEVDNDGVALTPGRIHAALRKFAGIDGTELDAMFPVEEPINLFG